MGWTYQQAQYYKNGRIDRKAECDAYFLEGLNQGYYAVDKSAMVGSVYYAAVRGIKKRISSDKNEKLPGEEQKERIFADIYEDIPEAEQHVFAVVFLTGIDNGWFGYKDMDESMGPYCYECPQSILKLLSPTENKSALEWREKCSKFKKEKVILNRLPLGTEIDVRGLIYQKTKRNRRTMWINWEKYQYLPKNNILAAGYEIVKEDNK